MRYLFLFSAILPHLKQLSLDPNLMNPRLLQLKEIILEAFEEDPHSFAILFTKTRYMTVTDSVFGKRVLTYWENRENFNYHQVNVFIEDMEKYIFLERGQGCHILEKILEIL